MKTIIAFLAATFFVSFAYSELVWEVGESRNENTPPKTFVPSEVPGAVQLDFAKALNYPDYRFADNAKQFEWMEDRFYTYKTSFKKVDLKPSQRLLFESESIDYRFKIFLNGRLLLSQEGMFTPVSLDITDLQKPDNVLEILVFPAPKADLADDFGRSAKHMHRTLARKSFKPPVSYGWDWHPRLIPLGICGKTGLRTVNASRLTDVYVNYSLSDDFSKADISLEVSGVNLDGAKYEWTLSDSDGKCVASASGVAEGGVFAKPVSLKNPNLWWPNGHGSPYLYSSAFKLFSADGKLLQTDEQKIGFRRVKLVPNKGAWSEPSQQGKTRSVPPMQLEINGRKIFVKGSNWVNPEIFPSKVGDERYEKLTDYAVDLNFNMLRMWGGAPVAREKFFEICDRKGLMVWQEFILGCNQYPDDEKYLKVLRQEARSIVKRLRKHACLARWCGGNELFNGWSQMTEQSLPLRNLNSITLELDPRTPFNCTSPLMGVIHGPYRFVIPTLNPTEDIFQYLQKLRATAYCEFGISSMSPMETIEKIIPENERFPMRQTPSWIMHHAFRDMTPYRAIDDIHGNKRVTYMFCGTPKSLEDQIEKSQFIQSEGYKFMFEEMRRQKPYCAMALNWCYNDAWESGGNESIIAYPDIKKLAFYGVKAACRPFLVSARPAKFVWKPAEKFTLTLFALNDSYKNYEPIDVRAYVVFDGKKREVANWKTPKIEPNKNEKSSEFSFEIPDLGKETKRFKLIVEAVGFPEYSSEYEFMYKPDFTFEYKPQ